MCSIITRLTCGTAHVQVCYRRAVDCTVANDCPFRIHQLEYATIGYPRHPCVHSRVLEEQLFLMPFIVKVMPRRPRGLFPNDSVRVERNFPLEGLRTHKWPSPSRCPSLTETVKDSLGVHRNVAEQHFSHKTLRRRTHHAGKVVSINETTRPVDSAGYDHGRAVVSL